ncbi:MAG: protein-glutamate O-methyltransferase CheR [Planctomycetes bacterium]|nr:protein-glutamate O-methyltransferase CheR [Planctomycetota bacterium]
MSLAAQDFQFVCTLVRERSAIVLESGKEYLVESRLGPLAKVEGLPSVESLVAKMRSNPNGELTDKVIEAMTTNETLFFRDKHPFEALREEVLPELIERNRSKKELSLWCAASSSGQEPYTVCMLLREHFPELKSWKVRFLASDLSRNMLERVRVGAYSQLEVNRGLPASYLVKYFTKEGATWMVKPELRDMLDLREINLCKPWLGLPKFDIVFIRNVLIYFDAETKRQIMGRIRGLLNPGGIMFLGGSETTINIDDEFQRVRRGSTWVYRIAG